LEIDWILKTGDTRAKTECEFF